MPLSSNWYIFKTCTLSSVTIVIYLLRIWFSFLQKKDALPCGVCRGKGYYICKLCKGNATIKWSPLHDPIAMNPCLCPTCDGNRLVIGVYYLLSNFHIAVGGYRLNLLVCCFDVYCRVQRCLNCLGKGYN